MKYIYEITEEDVDGCGGTAVEYVSSNRALMETDMQALKACLDDAKKHAVETGTDDDTAGMVHNAVELFYERTGRVLHSADDPVDGRITF